MANFAVINNGVVVNTILADSKEIAEEVTGLTCIEYEFEPGAPGIGHSWDGVSFSFSIDE
jgi:hypothetical protein